MKRLSLVMLLGIVYIAGCGAAYESFDSANVAMHAVTEAPAADWQFDLPDSRYGAMMSVEQIEQMLIRTAHLSLETSRFSYTADEAERLTALYGGFVESAGRSLTRGRATEFWVANYVLRVPVAHFDTVIRAVSALGNVRDYSTSSEDVTAQFRDMESRMRIREEEERRVLAMIENTSEIEALIQLESRLGDLRLDMERQRSRMAEIDNLASFSTIHLHVTEVPENAPDEDDSFFAQLGAAFDDSVNFSLGLLTGLALLAAALVLPLSIVGVIILGIFLLLKKLSRTGK